MILDTMLKLEDFKIKDSGEIYLFTRDFSIITHLSNVVIYEKGGDYYARILHS